jgi:hypothetical protein
MHILACRGALTAQGSIPTRVGARIDVAFRFHNNVSTLDWLISQLHTSPTSAPVNASPLTSRPDTHDSGNSVVRYTFTIWDLHPLCIANLPGALWTHPGLQGPCRVTARRITTARIYPACHMEDTCALPALMDSALFLLNSLTTSDGLCEKQDLEEPV